MPPRRDDCLFCKLYRDGDHVAATKGFVAIKDINPQAPVHLLVIPEHHVDTFRDVGEPRRGGDPPACSSSSPTPPATRGSRTTRCRSTSARSAGQTVFHLHWHILGRKHIHGQPLPDSTEVTEL